MSARIKAAMQVLDNAGYAVVLMWGPDDIYKAVGYMPTKNDAQAIYNLAASTLSDKALTFERLSDICEEFYTKKAERLFCPDLITLNSETVRANLKGIFPHLNDEQVEYLKNRIAEGHIKLKANYVRRIVLAWDVPDNFLLLVKVTDWESKYNEFGAVRFCFPEEEIKNY